MMVNQLKRMIDNILKTHVDYQTKYSPNQQTARLQPFISRLLQNIDPVEITNPQFFMNLAFEMFIRMPNRIVKTKWEDPDDYSTIKFSRMLEEFNAGHLPISGQHALEILQPCNKFAGKSKEHLESGAAVAWHFGVSSSFTRKGRLLYTAVRFFRPGSVLEVGTAYGM